MKIAIIAEGSEDDLDLLLLIAKRFGIKVSRPDENKVKSHMELQKESHKSAYLPWTNEDDEKLEILFYAGKKVKELSEIFERNEGAIKSRIKKLELVEKYGKKN